MPWWLKIVQITIDFVTGIFGKNPDDPNSKPENKE
jgi:hypothetical protein